MDKILKYIKFNWCFNLLIATLVLVIYGLFCGQIFGFLIHKFHEIAIMRIIIDIYGYINFILRKFIEPIFRIYVFLGFFKYGELIKNDKFKQLILYAVFLKMLSSIFAITGINKYIYIGLSVYAIVTFLFFRAFEYIKDSDLIEIIKLSKYFRYRFFFALFILAGYLLMLLLYNIGRVIFHTGGVLQIICNILIFYWSLLLFKKLHRKYELGTVEGA